MMARRAQFAVIGEIDTTISLDSLAVLEEVMRHFYLKAKVLQSMGQEGDYEEVSIQANAIASFRHWYVPESISTWKISKPTPWPMLRPQSGSRSLR